MPWLWASIKLHLYYLATQKIRNFTLPVYLRRTNTDQGNEGWVSDLLNHMMNYSLDESFWIKSKFRFFFRNNESWNSDFCLMMVTWLVIYQEQIDNESASKKSVKPLMGCFAKAWIKGDGSSTCIWLSI